MASPYQYPWVEFGSILISGIDSSEFLLFTADKATIFDSILITNTTEEEIFVDFSILGERTINDVLVDQKPFVARKRLVEKSQSIDLLTQIQTSVTLQYGDFAYANSDFSGNTFDCIISYRKLLETA